MGESLLGERATRWGKEPFDGGRSHTVGKGATRWGKEPHDGERKFDGGVPHDGGTVKMVNGQCQWTGGGGEAASSRRRGLCGGLVRRPRALL